LHGNPVHPPEGIDGTTDGGAGDLREKKIREGRMWRAPPRFVWI
jgi:hypothetical protein